ncbi:MAG: helix-turn-helix domain-containing protein [Actinomycetia bacterium]|nr:helix-turn-helix domain-containing protein [Actinomycetes bacterium]
MTIQSVRIDNRKREWLLETSRGRFSYPFAKCDPEPTSSDHVMEYFIDDELAREAVTYVLESGREGFVHSEMAFDYNCEPAYMRDLLLHQLTLDVLRSLEANPLPKREIMRRLETSAAQVYRLLDPENYTKSVDSMLELLSVLGCEVELTVRKRTA